MSPIEVTDADVSALVKDLMYMKVSAKTGDNVGTAFESIIRMFLKEQETHEPTETLPPQQSSVSITVEEPTKRNCC